MNGDFYVGDHKMVSGEFLMEKLGEYCLFPEVRGQVAIGFGDVIKGSLGDVIKVAVYFLA